MKLHDILRGGDIVSAAQSGDGGVAQTLASALLGLGQEAIDRLSAIDDHNARFIHAVALWIDGQDDAALGMLRQAPDSVAARRLNAIISKDRVRALCFIPPHREGPHAIYGAALQDPRFRIENVYFDAAESDGIRNEIDADIHHFYRRSAQPDLLISEMAEWHVLPRNLAEAPFFKVAHTSDFDIHGQEVLPWLRQFNAVLTLDHTELNRLRRAMPGHEVLNYPKVFTVSERPAPAHEERPIDVLMTGTVYSDFHHDKNELISRLVGMPDLNCVFLNGFVSHAEYEALTRKSKFTLSFVRHSGTMPTRALESLALGTWSILQEDSALRLYLPERAAVIPYRHGDWTRFVTDIQSGIASYRNDRDAYEATALQSRAAVCRAFAPDRVASQYLRFCAALPALMLAMDMVPIAETPPMPVLQRRGCVTKGWLPANGAAHVMQSLLERNVAIAATLPGYVGHNLAGREKLIEYARRMNAGCEEPDLLDGALQAFQSAIAVNPSALAPRFNLIRAAYHFGGQDERQRAERLAVETLDLARNGKLSLAADDDLLPYDFYATHFHGQKASEIRLDAFGGDEAALAALMRLVIASINFYLACALGGRPEAEQYYQAANDLDGSHTHFQVAYSKYLLAHKPQMRRSAEEVLRYVVGSKTWTPVLDSLSRNAVSMAARQQNSAQACQIFLDVEDEVSRSRRYSMARSLSMTGELYFGQQHLSSQVPDAALVLCGAGISVNPQLPELLAELRAKASAIEIVLIDTCLDTSTSPLAAQVDALLTAPQPGALAYSSKLIAGLLSVVRAPYVFLAQPDCRNFEAIVRHVLRFADMVRGNSQLTERRPLLYMTKAENPAVDYELLSVGLPVRQLREANLPQGIGMLQDARLTLPILVHQLRYSVEGFYTTSSQLGQIYFTPGRSARFDLDQFVEPLWDVVLQTVSPDWRRFIAESSRENRGRLSERAPEHDSIAVAEASIAAELAGLPQEFSPVARGVVFDRRSLVYRLARAIYRAFLDKRQLGPDGVLVPADPSTLVVNMGLFRFEYIHPHLRVSRNRRR